MYKWASNENHNFLFSADKHGYVLLPVGASSCGTQLTWRSETYKVEEIQSEEECSKFEAIIWNTRVFFEQWSKCII